LAQINFLQWLEEERYPYLNEIVSKGKHEFNVDYIVDYIDDDN